MPESENSPQQKKPKNRPNGSDQGGSRNLAARVERSLKDVDRLLNKNPGSPPYERAMAQLERAKVSALLQLAESIREARRTDQASGG